MGGEKLKTRFILMHSFCLRFHLAGSIALGLRWGRSFCSQLNVKENAAHLMQPKGRKTDRIRNWEQDTFQRHTSVTHFICIGPTFYSFYHLPVVHSGMNPLANWSLIRTKLLYLLATDQAFSIWSFWQEMEREIGVNFISNHNWTCWVFFVKTKCLPIDEFILRP